MSSSTRLLKYAVPLVSTLGFTREALARSVLSLPSSETAKGHSEPLSDSAVTALFGPEDEARRLLVNAWLQEGLEHMRRTARITSTSRDLLVARLQYNEPILSQLPQAFALLGAHGMHIYDPLPALKHVAQIADHAYLLTQDQSLQLEWYARRGSLAAAYAAAELHQIASPHSAVAFLDSLLGSTAYLKSTLNEIGQYSNYVFKSWKGIIKSSGIL
ncbi:hypothetical protein CPB83DRAFT_866768 [Crepidotus variabilis]|uniref:COQ9 C-terminal domain-containing protein n=1 Tax=Crepidotus variabilis TaxID=179855 RepID=A0A9P6JU62_9AGAR|nr:hypothetical protein CPB83DRAFT_866768 [Crepidotus variabilis]